MRKRNKKQLEASLQECIERMEQRASIEECLEASPEQAEELRPLLMLARELKGSLSVEPSAAARQAWRRRLQGEIWLTEQRRKAPLLHRLTGPWRAWATAGALSVIVFVGGFGVVQGSSDSVPGQVLYPVKRTVEQARLSLPFQSREAKARLSAELAARRANEMAILARKNKTSQLAALTQRLEKHLTKAADISVGLAARELERLRETQGLTDPQRRQHLLEVRDRLEQDYRAGLARLQAVAREAPPEARPHILQAAERVKEHYLTALQRINQPLQSQGRPSAERTQQETRFAPPQRGSPPTVVNSSRSRR